MRSKIFDLNALLKRAEVDRTVFYGVISKVWSVAAGPITALLILTKFTSVIQGYYYTFASLLSLQVFVELGLGTVIVQFASHEWSKLKMDESGGITGDKESLSRLASLADITVKWYLVGGVIIAFGVSLGGYIFFSYSQNNPGVNWVFPWFFLCLLTGINICFTPIWSLLEGCNQISTIYTYRFYQGIISGVIAWLAIFWGAKLWSASILSAVTILCAITFLKFKYNNLIKTLLFLKPENSRINWRKEILPMQWRIAVSWISGYFIFSFFTPVIFRYYGAVVAGQFGMTWNVVGLVTRTASPWINAKIPRFGMLIARKSYSELDHLFGKITKIYVVITILSAIAVWMALYVLNILKHPFAARLLPVLPMTVFLIAEVIMMLSVPFSMYLIAHKKNPVFLVSVFAGLGIGLSTYILGKYYSVLAIAFDYLTINIIVLTLIILIWHRCKKAWHVIC